MSNPIRGAANAAADRFTDLVERVRTEPHYRIPQSELEIIQTSLEISKTFALIEISEKLRPSNHLEQMAELSDARDRLIQELERAHDRCPTCDHYSHAHGTSGCTFVFGTLNDPDGRYGTECPCDVTPEAAP